MPSIIALSHFDAKMSSYTSPSGARTPCISEEEEEDRNQTMPGLNRSAGRSVHLFNSADRDTTIGGLILTNGITNSNLYAMVEIIAVFTSEFNIQDRDGATISKDDAQLQPGDYFIYSRGKIYLLCY